MRSAIAMLASTAASSTLLAQSILSPGKDANRGRGISGSKRLAGNRHRKTIIRGEPRNSDTAPSGSFARVEQNGLLFLTNAFGFSYQIPLDSYIEWHLDDRDTTMRFRCLNSDQYRVKAFPCAVLGTMGGRWETAGKLTPLAGMEKEFRMKGDGMQTPLFDMQPALKNTGFPCLLGDLPETTVQAKTRYQGNPTVNTFLDMYLHDVDNPDTASHPDLLGDINAINSNRTKAYNINVWFKLPEQSNGTTDRPDGAWAGGKVIGPTSIAGQMFNVIMKIETGGANYFRYIALLPAGGSLQQLSVNAVMDWAQTELRGLLESHSDARQMMAKPDPRGYPAPRWPDQKMVLSGLHLGNEIWWSDPNGEEGVVHWDTLRIDVAGIGSFGWGDEPVTNLASTTTPATSAPVKATENAAPEEAAVEHTVASKGAVDNAQQQKAVSGPEQEPKGILQRVRDYIFNFFE